ncbi:hypothetical protein C3941_19800 [Kaistia algarum]|uniref:hypothetical protein n=1 Tax=Kaistia algarum TaxID=2083279 RepID=UPI000CE733BE|nr:hypothetical protein [Kaistia algarum]MCX5516237.1 hypothetical protein [Kaistia algarum]PPE78308.1 hypothetical protein C3941_19800 [Kaistia algarum]
MADENILREYLVALGFKIDAAGEKRFQGSLESAGKTAAAVAAGLTAAVTAIQVAVIKIASGFDDLYFAAQRTNTSVSNIKALSYALGQLGADGSTAERAIAAVAQSLRTNPAKESLLQQLGVQTRDAKGGLRETVDILVDLDKALSKQPQYIGAQYAALFGLDENTFNIIRGRADEIQKLMERQKKAAAEMGVDPDKAAKAANELMTNFRDLQMQIGLVVDKIAVELGPAINEALKNLQTWIAEHKDEIVAAVTAVSKALVGVAEDLVSLAKNLEPVWTAFDGMAKSVGKDGLQGALELVLAYTAGRWLLGMKAAAGEAAGAFGWLTPILALIGGGSMAINAVTDQPMRSPVTGMWNRGYSGPGMINPAGEAPRGRWTWGGLWQGFKEKIGLGGGSGGNVSSEGGPLLDLIMKAEGTTTRGFDDSFGHQIKGTLTDKTVAQILDIQKGMWGSSAIGAFQIMRSTLRDAIKAGVVGTDDLFTPENQRKIANWLVARRMKEADALQARYGGDIAYWRRFTLSKEWASFPDPANGDRSHYAGQRSSISADSVTAALADSDKPIAKPVPVYGEILPVPRKPVEPNGDSYKAYPPPLTAPAPAASDDWWSRDRWLAPGPLLPVGTTNSSSKTTTIAPNTTVNVYGASDPVATGAAVEKAQGRVNKNIISNVTGAVQ